MNSPLAPLSDNGQTLRTSGTIVRQNSEKSIKTPTSSYTLEADENVFETSSTVAPTSPITEDDEPDLRLANKPLSPSKHRTPRRIDTNQLPLTESTLRENEDLTRAMKTVERSRNKESTPEAASARCYSPNESCFSAFSAIPNADMTAFARLALSPSKTGVLKSANQAEGPRTPKQSRPPTPGTARTRNQDPFMPPSPTPRRKSQDVHGNNTQLMDFTEQFSYHQTKNRTPARNGPPSPTRNQESLPYAHAHRLRSPIRDGFHPRTPAGARQLANLLDFDLPPAPTPRSAPSISARELESLKASFLSQISSLKASLSGKDAEIASLQLAKDDAERRVGEALETLRETRDTKEVLQTEKEDWEKRDREMDKVLREVREQIMHTEAEREQLAARLEESDKCRDEAEMRASEAESRVSGSETAAASGDGGGPAGDASTPGSSANQAVQAAVHNVSRELHMLYKAKHEEKVGKLKKSYEARWGKKLKDLQARIDNLGREKDALVRENDDLRLRGTDDVPGLPTPARESERESDGSQAEKDTALDEASRTIDRLNAELAVLAEDLDVSRRENGDLVAAVETMLSLEATTTTATTTTNASASASASAPAPTSSRPASRAQSQTDTPRGRTESVKPAAATAATTATTATGQAKPAPAPSGLRGPGFGIGGESRIAMGVGVKRTVSVAGRSGIMSNIERMGRGRAAE